MRPRPRPRPGALQQLLLAGALTACAPAPLKVDAPAASLPPLPSATAAAPAAPPAVVTRDFDPLAGGLSPEGIKKLCDDHLRSARALADAIGALRAAPPAALTFEATFGRFDDVLLELDDATELPYVLSFVESDPPLREAARLCEPKAVEARASIYLDADVGSALAAYAAKGEPLVGERARLVTDVLRDLRRSGAGLPADKQARLRDLQREIPRVEQQYMGNLAAAVGDVQVPPGSLQGLPAAFVAAHKPKSHGTVEITTDARDYEPFITYTADRKAALELYEQHVNRGGDDNVRLFERLLRLRSEKAKLLGYATWAAYVLEPRLARTPARVREFLGRVHDRLEKPARADLAELVHEHLRSGGRAEPRLPPPDRFFLEERVRASRYKLDSQELAKYFEVSAVVKGVLDLTARMYGLEYRPSPARAWDPEVTALDVLSAGRPVGRLYLDLYARAGKYEQVAMFPLRTGKRWSDGAAQAPMAVLSCGFARPSAEVPSLLAHEEVVTFFHEMGHAMHQLLGRSELAAYSGTSVARDFAEVPSQLFEEWAYAREVLDLFARHYQTGVKIPEPMLDALQRSRAFGRALDLQHTVFLASVDLELHARDPGFDVTKLVEELATREQSFAHVPGTHLVSSFAHLITYSAAYYGYPWSLALARDALTRFRKEGLLDPTACAAFRDEVLAKGGGVDEGAQLATFLGRAPSEDAFFAYLEGKD